MVVFAKPPNVAGTSTPAVLLCLFVATGGLLFGYDTGSINGILAMNKFKEDFSTGYREPISDEKGMYPSEVSLIVAMLSAGTMMGALISAPMGDFWGRRLSLIAAIGVFCIGAIFQVCATNVPLLVVGRTLAGIGVGIVSVLVPLYQSEVAPKYLRGSLVAAYQLSITIGLLAAAGVNILTYKMASVASYRIPIGLQLTWAIVLALGLLVLPETPRYLVKRGYKDAAALSLSRLRRLDITHPALIEELAEIQANHEYEMALGPDTYKEILFGEPHLGRRTLTGCGLQMLQQLTGVNFIMYYGTTFFEGAGVKNPFLISLIMQIINMVSTFPGVIIVEAWGRRRLLIVGSIGMAICQLLIASFATAIGDSHQQTQNQILIIFVAIYIFFFAASWGPVVWVVTSEIYPLKIRAKAMSVSTASNWLLNFGIAYGTPYMVGSEGPSGRVALGSRVFFVWGAFCIVSVAFVWFMVYETGKISLEQIDEMYERVDHAWNSRSFEPAWSFQQMRDFGFSESGIPPTDPQLELQPSRTSTTQSDTGGSSTTHATTTTSQDDKVLSQLGHVDFSY
ncbi:general substrate transporter [Cladorrhinum samala]|uniref:General substrate transporter n=1 Tax=Cladorrhinum samala TaxID=585594 RepID=A0AAV9HP89_9PEZI|nr:general substrate transporter [Cladorrhinum samala]